jgi:hypothetical protein
MTTNDEVRAEALRQYIDTYRKWNSARISSEEATADMVAAARNALSIGITLREIKDARKAEDAKAERMTSLD